MSIPISVSLQPTLEAENIDPKPINNKNRIITISALAVGIAVCISFIAKLLVYLINLVTNLAFHGNLSVSPSSPATHSLGIWVIIVPVIGGGYCGLNGFIWVKSNKRPWYTGSNGADID